MIEETVAIVCLFGLIALFLLKVYNAMRQGELYPVHGILLSFALGWIFWLLFFMSMSSTFLVEETITTPDSQVYTIAANAYVTYSMYLSLTNILIGLISLITFLEILFIFNKVGVVKKPLKARGAKHGLF